MDRGWGDRKTAQLRVVDGKFQSWKLED